MTRSLEIIQSNHNEGTQEVRELAERRDSFANTVRLLWDPNDNSVHLRVASFDIEVPGDQAAEAFEHPYPLVNSTFGSETVESLTVAAAEAA